MRAAPPTPAPQCLSAHACACSRLDFDALYAYLSTSNYDFNVSAPTTQTVTDACSDATLCPCAVRPRQEPVRRQRCLEPHAQPPP